MAHGTHNLPPDRHVPAHPNQGWPVVIAIVVLAIVANTTAYLIHERTSSRSPLDPMFRAAGAAPETPLGAQPGQHGEAPAGQGGHGPSGRDQH